MHDHIFKMNFTNTAINQSILNNTIDWTNGSSSNSTTVGNGNTSNILESSSESSTAFTSAIVSSAMHFRNTFDASHQIDLKNANITAEELQEFLKKLVEYNQYNLSSENESIACEHYCNGFVKDVFTSYKRMHGYISLVVSIN